jgi:hypothetical protein
VHPKDIVVDQLYSKTWTAVETTPEAQEAHREFIKFWVNWLTEESNGEFRHQRAEPLMALPSIIGQHQEIKALPPRTNPENNPIAQPPSVSRRQRSPKAKAE